MAPWSSSHPLSQFCFESKTHFCASQDLSFARSKYFKQPETESRDDVLGIKPPDFSPKLYRYLSDPQKKQRKLSLNGSAPPTTETRRKTGLNRPHVLYETHTRTEPPKFITAHRPPGPQESELMFIKTGKYPSEPYINPKPHDFRPLDETLPDIVTKYDKDPDNLSLKLKHLDTLRITTRKSDCGSRETKTRMDTHKPAEPHWDARLILPQLPWPPKSASYTRHRRRRGAYSAFLDRVEEKLSRSWKTGS